MARIIKFDRTEAHALNGLSTAARAVYYTAYAEYARPGRGPLAGCATRGDKPISGADLAAAAGIRRHDLAARAVAELTAAGLLETAAINGLEYCRLPTFTRAQRAPAETGHCAKQNTAPAAPQGLTTEKCTQSGAEVHKHGCEQLVDNLPKTVDNSTKTVDNFAAENGHCAKQNTAPAAPQGLTTEKCTQSGADVHKQPRTTYPRARANVSGSGNVTTTKAPSPSPGGAHGRPALPPSNAPAMPNKTEPNGNAGAPAAERQTEQTATGRAVPTAQRNETERPPTQSRNAGRPWAPPGESVIDATVAELMRLNNDWHSRAFLEKCTRALAQTEPGWLALAAIGKRLRIDVEAGARKKPGWLTNRLKEALDHESAKKGQP